MTWQAESMASLVEDLRFRGLIHQMTDPALGDRLDAGGLTAYSGFDPTADSLHVGHLLQMCNLRRLQLAGHRPIALAGGGTGFVGDPGGKSEERSLLTEEQLRANLAGIHGQLERILEFGPGDDHRALLLNNADWLRPLSLFEFLRDVGKHFTVNQMVAKDSVKSRLARAEQGISYTEFSYMLLQAYDFRYLFEQYGCQLQLGGSDQWGNITMGIDLIRKSHQQEAWGLTTPLVLKADGTKFGKTESGTVWLDADRTSPYQLYQFFLRSEDAVVGAYLRYFTFLEREAILALDEATASHPERREAQRELARNVCSLVHGPVEAERAEQAAAALFGGELTRARRAVDSSTCSPKHRRPTMARTRLEGPGLPLVDTAGRHGYGGPFEGTGPHDHRTGWRLRQQPSHERPGGTGRSAPGHLVAGSLPGAPAGKARLPPGPGSNERPESDPVAAAGPYTGRPWTAQASPPVRAVTGPADRGPARDGPAGRGGARLCADPPRAAAMHATRRDPAAPCGVRRGPLGRPPARRSGGACTRLDWPVTDLEAYACFRVGYHRGLDALRAAGWKGSGLVRWAHESNRGFLRCLDGLRSSAGAHRRA